MCNIGSCRVVVRQPPVHRPLSPRSTSAQRSYHGGQSEVRTAHEDGQARPPHRRHRPALHAHTLIRQLTHFDSHLATADLCLTAEGKVDASTDAGKTVRAVVDACAQPVFPCVVLGGTITPDADRLYRHGATAVLAIGTGPDLDTALRHAADDLTRTAYAVCRLAPTMATRSLALVAVDQHAWQVGDG
ncbi:glycerate kinase [Streptomyces violaceus]|uniref:glycerate kinase n=1 Tax=Streptomyces violaceus TaxID=1936 RepID=UPI00399D769F